MQTPDEIAARFASNSNERCRMREAIEADRAQQRAFIPIDEFIIPGTTPAERYEVDDVPSVGDIIGEQLVKLEQRAANLRELREANDDIIRESAFTIRDARRVNAELDAELGALSDTERVIRDALGAEAGA